MNDRDKLALDRLSDEDAEMLLITVLKEAGISERGLLPAGASESALAESIARTTSGDVVRAALRALRDNTGFGVKLATRAGIERILQSLGAPGEDATFASNKWPLYLILLMVLRALQIQVKVGDPNNPKAQFGFDGREIMAKPDVATVIQAIEPAVPRPK